MFSILKRKGMDHFMTVQSNSFRLLTTMMVEEILAKPFGNVGRRVSEKTSWPHRQQIQFQGT